VHGKGNRTDRLPLPADVGQAIAGYCRRGRPRGGCRALFVQARAPYAALSAAAVSKVVEAACRRAGLPKVGAHRLRHTAATNWERRGVASDATFRDKREHPRPGLQLQRPSQRAGRVRGQSGDDLRCHHPVASNQTMLQLLLLHPVIRMMQQMQQKAQRRGGMPLPPARQADVFGRVGKPLPTSCRAGAPLFEIGQLLRHQYAVTTAGYARDDLNALAEITRCWPGGAA
jgi:Phage integrase family